MLIFIEATATQVSGVAREPFAIAERGNRLKLTFLVNRQEVIKIWMDHFDLINFLFIKLRYFFTFLIPSKVIMS